MVHKGGLQQKDAYKNKPQQIVQKYRPIAANPVGLRTESKGKLSVSMPRKHLCVTRSFGHVLSQNTLNMVKGRMPQENVHPRSVTLYNWAAVEH